MYETIDLRPYFATLVARWRLIVALIALTTIAAAGVTLLSAPEYEATSGLLILRTRTTATFDSDINTATEAELGLDQGARRRALAALIRSPDVERRVREALPDDGESDVPEEGGLLGAIEVEVGANDMILIRAVAEEATEAADLANAWAGAAASYINEVFNSPQSSMTATIEEQIAQAQSRYAQASDELAEFQGSNTIPVLTSQIRAEQRMLDYYAQRELERLQLLERAELLQAQVEAGGVEATSLQVAVTTLLAQAATYTSLPTTIEVTEDSTQTTTVERTFPLQLQIQSSGETPELGALADQLDGFVVALQDQQAQQATDQPTQQVLTRLQQAQKELTREEEQLSQLTAQRDVTREAYEKLVRRAEELNVQPSSEVRFALSALPPQRPVNGSLLRALLLGVLAGSILGIAGAFLADMVAGGGQRLVPVSAAQR